MDKSVNRDRHGRGMIKEGMIGREIKLVVERDLQTCEMFAPGQDMIRESEMPTTGPQFPHSPFSTMDEDDAGFWGYPVSEFWAEQRCRQHLI